MTKSKTEKVISEQTAPLSRKAKWQSREAFCYYHNIKEPTLYSFAWKHGLLGKVLTETMVDSAYFTRRMDFKKQQMSKAQDRYYLLRRYWNDSDIAEFMHIAHPEASKATWIDFLREKLFANDTDSIMKFKLSPLQWRFAILSRSMVRLIFSFKGLRACELDILKVYDLDEK